MELRGDIAQLRAQTDAMLNAAQYDLGMVRIDMDVHHHNKPNWFEWMASNMKEGSLDQLLSGNAKGTPKVEAWKAERDRLAAREQAIEGRIDMLEAVAAAIENSQEREAGRDAGRGAEAWYTQTGGITALRDGQRADAEKAYAKWSTVNPPAAGQVDLTDYIKITQEKHAERDRAQERGAEGRGGQVRDRDEVLRDFQQKKAQEQEKAQAMSRG